MKEKGKKGAKATAPVASAAHPGQSVREAAKSLEQKIRAGGPGDKVESHVSEEELGISTRESADA